MDDKNKFSKIKVETPKGVRYITYKPVPGVKADELVCETRCPYGKICDKLRDPRHPEDKNLCFMDFCGEFGSESPKGLSEMIPKEGSLEEVFSDFEDIFQTLIKENPMVRLSDIIEKVCSGWCDDHNEEHTNCVASNKSCLLHDLFLKH